MNELVLPELGENIDDVDVSAVLVAIGDRVHRDQPIIEVETEKASLEVPSTADGTISEVRVKVGDKVKVGQVIVVIDGSGDQAPAKPSAEADDSDSGAGSDRLASEPAEKGGDSERGPEPSSAEGRRAAPERPSRDDHDPVPAAPSVRALARELGLDIRDVPGSGPAGRISKDDVKSHAKQRIAGAPAAAASRQPELPDFSRWGPVEREPLGKVRRVTAAGMSRAWATVPHVTQFDRADVTHLESMRKDFNRRPSASGAKLTMTALVLKVVASALRRFPKFNASFDASRDELILKGYVHVGVAVDTEHGLLVPVIRDADRLGLLDLAGALDDLADRARRRKLAPDEMAGAGFTVSNLGGLGTTYFSPIVNWPEVAILGVGRAEVQAVHQDGEFVPRLILPLAVSYDHRVIDGADAARFLRWIAETLEQPLLLLLDGREGGR